VVAPSGVRLNVLEMRPLDIVTNPLLSSATALYAESSISQSAFVLPKSLHAAAIARIIIQKEELFIRDASIISLKYDYLFNLAIKSPPQTITPPTT
jgi:hypothetical protein